MKNVLKVILPSVIFTLAAGSTLAEWQLVGSNGKEFSLFADLDSSRRAGSIVTIPQMVTFGEPQFTRASNQRYMSEKTLVEYDCAAKRARTVSTEQYAGDRASGTVVFREANVIAPWLPVPSNTNMAVALQRACDGSKDLTR